MPDTPAPDSLTVEEILDRKLAALRDRTALVRGRIAHLQRELQAARSELEEARAALDELAELRAALPGWTPTPPDAA